MPYSYFEWLQGFFIVHNTIGSTVHSMPLNSLEHCICTTTMTNILPDRDSSLVPPGYKPQSIRMSHRGRPLVIWYNMWHLRELQSDLQSDIFCLAQPLLTSNSYSALLGCLACLPWHFKVFQSYDMPINHISLTQCCFTAGPPPLMLSQH